MSRDRYEWGPWIEHDGQGCPDMLLGRFAEVIAEAPDCTRLQGAYLIDAEAACCHSWYGARWGWRGGVVANIAGKDIAMRWVVRYRIRKSGMDILQELVANPGQSTPAPKIKEGELV